MDRKEPCFNILENTDYFLKFDVSNVSSTMCNSFRRIMISDVPTFAVEIVSILKNNSIMTDDILAHRIGLIPVSIINTAVFNPDKHIIKLSVSYNKNIADINGICTIYSSAFEYDKSVIHINPDIIVTMLLKDQCIELDAILKEGTGYEHAKWSPVTACTFFPKISNKQNAIEENDSFTFVIESIGQKKSIDIFLKSIDILQKKLESTKQYASSF
jgi:DNA-directed RNA polymerase alpha subunit